MSLGDIVLSTTLREDAYGESRRKKKGARVYFTVTIAQKPPKGPKTFVFKYSGGHGGVCALLEAMKKDRRVDLIVGAKGNNLEVRCVRVGGMDYRVKER